MGDLFGRKRVFVTGLVGFATASAIGGYTTTFTWAAAVFAVGALPAWLLLPSGARDEAPRAASAEPVFPH